MKNKMNFDEFYQDPLFNINRILLSLTGLWPSQTKVKRYMIYSVFILLVGSGLIYQIIGLKDVLHDILKLLDAMPVLILAIAMILQLSYAVYTMPEMKFLLVKMQEYCVSPKSIEESKIYHSHAIIGRNLGRAYTYIVMSLSVFYNVATLVSKFIHREVEKNNTSPDQTDSIIGLPYRANYLVDLDEYYPLIYMHTTFCSTFYIFMSVVLDVLYITMIEHSRGMFANVKYCFENAFFENDNDNDLTKTVRDQSYLNIVYSIRRHVEAIKFITSLNTLYKGILFLHLTGIMTMLGVVGYQVMANTSSLESCFRNASFMNGLILNQFFENWEGQKIIDSSEEIFIAAFNAKWYNMPLCTRKLLLLVMMNSLNPIVITAGDFVAMSFVTFNAVMRTALSYFTIMRSMS